MAINLNVLHNYFVVQTKLFSNLYLAKFLDLYFSKIVLSVYRSLCVSSLLLYNSLYSLKFLTVIDNLFIV